MKRIFARLGAAVLLLAVLVSAVPMAAMADDPAVTPDRRLTSYEVWNYGQTARQSAINKGGKVTVVFHIKDFGVATDQVGDASKINVTKLLDDFTSCESITSELKSSGTDLLEYTITLKGLVYSGSGNSVNLMIGYDGLSKPATFTQTIREAVEYVPPSDDPYTPDPLPEPTVIISWEPMAEPIKAGQVFEVTVKIQNTSNIALRSPIIKCSPSDSLMLTDGTNTYAISDIGAKKTATFKVKLKAMSTISSSQQSLGIDLSFNYYNNVSTTRGTASQQVIIYAQAAGTIPEPPVIITRSTLEPVSAGQEFQLTITYKNAGETALVNPVAKVSLSEGLMLLNDSSTFILKDIPAGGTGTVILKLRAASQISSATQSVSTDLRYSYNSGSSLTQGSTSESLPVPAKTSEPVSEPVVIVTRSALEPVSGGQEFTLTISYRNAGATALVNPVAKVSLSEGLMLLDDSSTFILKDIPAGATGTVTLRLRAADQLTSATQSVSTDLRYSYNSGSSLTQASVSESLPVPAKVSGSVSEPVVLITRNAMDPVSAKDEFDLTITFRNAGTTALISPVARISTPNDLVLQNDTATFILEDIPAGEARSIVLKLKASDQISSSMLTVSADLRYSYDAGGTISSATASEQLSLTANPTAGNSSSPVPNLIISDFSFGGSSVAAGEPYDLTFTVRNTGTLAVENIVAVVNGGECFTINGATNTFYYTAIPAGGSQTQTIPLQTLATARTGAQTVSLSFRYEYVDNGNRSSSSADITLSIPVYQPDRLEFGTPSLFDTAYAGMETTITMTYVNKGKGDISNVEASISGDVDVLQASQYLGNFESGKSGNISFVVTPWNAGDIDLTITITYEDANAETVTKEFPLTLSVMEMPGPIDPIDPVDPVDPVPENNGLKWWVYVIIGAVVAAVAVIIPVSVKKKKAKTAASAASQWDDWDDDDSAPGAGNKDTASVGAGGKEE